jgi:acetyl-CoA carboxylase beta subunit
MNLWAVGFANKRVICTTVRDDREEAKRTAARWLGVGMQDQFVVEPLAKDHDQVHFDVTLQV